MSHLNVSDHETNKKANTPSNHDIWHDLKDATHARKPSIVAELKQLSKEE